MDGIASHHESWGWIGDMLLILALAGLVMPALSRMRISPVVGYLLCGLLLGPNGLGRFMNGTLWIDAFTITDTGLINILAELGVVFLLFMIGLELTLSRLWDLRKLVLGLGSVQIIATAVVMFLIAQQFGNATPAAILVGAAFALSSTAIIMQLLTERRMVARPVGRVCFSVLLMQDMAVVPILVLVGAFSGHQDSPLGVLLIEALSIAAAVIVGIFLTGRLFLPRAMRLLNPSKNTESLLALSLFLIIGTAAVTQSTGLSAALGAFLAGLLLAETAYRHEIGVIIEPVKAILLGIFFLSVGMATDIAEFLQNPAWIALSVIGIFLIKAALFYPLARLFALPRQQAAQAAILLAQCGEFALLVIGLAMAGGIITHDDGQFFLLVASLSLLVTPLTTRLAPLVLKILPPEPVSGQDEVPSAASSGNHIILAGFGRIGQTLADILDEQMIPYVAIDCNNERVTAMLTAGYPVVYGHAAHIDLWKKLNGANARAAIVTIDDYEAARHILQTLRKEWPLLPIIIRARDMSALDDYYDLGASAVIPEILEPALQLARTILTTMGHNDEEAHRITNQYRREALQRALLDERENR